MSQSDSQEENEEEWRSTDWADPEGICCPHKFKFHDQETRGLPKDMEHVKRQLQVSEKVSVPESQSKSGVVNRMLLNDNKAGMVGLDKEKINQIIMEASKGSRFYENERKKEEQMTKRIEEQSAKLDQITEEQLKSGQIEADRLLEEFEQARDLSRTIVHIDMDAFYAAVEMRENPSLKDKPMAVGGMSMLSTSNYHARKFGVRAAMPGFIGKKLCPELIIVPTNFDKYTEISKMVRQVLAEYDPNFSPMSLDEAYLDMTEHLSQRFELSDYERTVICRKTDGCSSTLCNCDLNLVLKPLVLQHDIKTEISESIANTVESSVCPMCGKAYPEYDLVTFGMSADDAVHEMRSRVEQKTRLTASAGIAPNTMLAKVCSDKNKPNGQYRIPPDRDKVMEFIKDLPTRKISGIGKVSETMLNALGVFTCQDLYHQRATLYQLYSSISFNYFMRICIGIGSTFVERDNERKSMSTERTFSELSKPADLFAKCEELSNALSEDLKNDQLKGKTVAIKIKTVEFEVKTRAHTLSDHTNESDVIFAAAKELLKTEIQNVAPKPLRLRLMGVRMSSLLHQSLCKKKQNTITGFIKRMGIEKQKNERSEHTIQISGKVREDDNVDVPEESMCQSISMDTNHETTFNNIDHVLRIRAENDSKGDSDFVGERGMEFDLNIIDCSKERAAPLSDKQSELKNTSDLIQKIRNGLLNQDDDTHSLENEETEKPCRVVPLEAGEKNFENSSSFKDSVTEEGESFVCPVCQNSTECKDLTDFNQHIDICLNKKVVKDCTKQAHEEDKNFKQPLLPNKKKSKAVPKSKPSMRKGKIMFSPISTAISSKVNNKKGETTSKMDFCKGVNSKVEREAVIIDLSEPKDLDIAGELNQNFKPSNPTQGKSDSLIITDTADASSSKTNVSPKNGEETETGSLVCPVCFMEQRGNDLDAFNKHVDTCLSKDAITQIVRHENTSAVISSSSNSTRVTPTSKSKKRAASSPSDKQGKKKQKMDRKNQTIDSFFKI